VSGGDIRHRGLDTALCFLLSGAAGLVAWIGTSEVTGRREAWDSPAYLTFGFPLLLVTCGACGWIARRRPWRWGLTAMVVQYATMWWRDPEGGPLWALGLVLMLAMSLPLTLAGAVGAWLHGRVDRRPI